MKAFLYGLQAMLFAFVGHPLDRAALGYRRAVKEHLRSESDLTYQTELRNFYEGQAEKLDPKTHWREYAYMKDLAAQCAEEVKAEQARVEKAQQTLRESCVKLERLQHRYPDDTVAAIS